MTSDISVDHIRLSVEESLRKAMAGASSPGLLPFTPAQLAFLREILTESLFRTLAKSS